MITLSPPAYSAATFAHVGLQVGVLVGDGGERAVPLLREVDDADGLHRVRPAAVGGVAHAAAVDGQAGARLLHVGLVALGDLAAHREERARLRAALQAAPQLAVALAPLRRRRLERADPVPTVGVELALEVAGDDRVAPLLHQLPPLLVVGQRGLVGDPDRARLLEQVRSGRSRRPRRRRRPAASSSGRCPAATAVRAPRRPPRARRGRGARRTCRAPARWRLRTCPGWPRRAS